MAVKSNGICGYHVRYATHYGAAILVGNWQANIGGKPCIKLSVKMILMTSLMHGFPPILACQLPTNIVNP